MKKSEVKALDKFIAGMVEKLEENKDKGGWKQNKDDWHFHRRLLEEVAEFFISLDHPIWNTIQIIQSFISAVQEVQCRHSDKHFMEKKITTKMKKQEQKRELADVGNIAMMLYDNT